MCLRTRAATRAERPRFQTELVATAVRSVAWSARRLSRRLRPQRQALASTSVMPRVNRAFPLCRRRPARARSQRARTRELASTSAMYWHLTNPTVESGGPPLDEILGGRATPRDKALGRRRARGASPVQCHASAVTSRGMTAGRDASRGSTSARVRDGAGVGVGTSIELFTGGGGLAMALHDAGFRHLLLNERDKRA